MREIDELTCGKTFAQLLFELQYQIVTMGETPGDTIVSHVYAECFKAASNEQERQQCETLMNKLTKKEG